MFIFNHHWFGVGVRACAFKNPRLTWPLWNQLQVWNFKLIKISSSQSSPDRPCPSWFRWSENGQTARPLHQGCRVCPAEGMEAVLISTGMSAGHGLVVALEDGVLMMWLCMIPPLRHLADLKNPPPSPFPPPPSPSVAPVTQTSAHQHGASSAPEQWFHLAIFISQSGHLSSWLCSARGEENIMANGFSAPLRQSIIRSISLSPSSYIQYLYTVFISVPLTKYLFFLCCSAYVCVFVTAIENQLSQSLCDIQRPVLPYRAA